MVRQGVYLEIYTIKNNKTHDANVNGQEPNKKTFRVKGRQHQQTTKHKLVGLPRKSRKWKRDAEAPQNNGKCNTCKIRKPKEHEEHK